MKRNLGLAVALLPLLTACVQHTWAPGPNAQGDYGSVSGRCKLMGMGSHEGFLAFGSPAFVGGAALGNAIGNAVRQQNVYNACMEASGFVAVDPQPAQAQPSVAAAR